MGIIENTVQFFNLQNVYLCTLPVELTSIICIWFILESSHRAFIFSGAVCRKQGGINLQHNNEISKLFLT